MSQVVRRSDMKNFWQISLLWLLLSLAGAPAWAMDCCCDDAGPVQQCEMEGLHEASTLTPFACDKIPPTRIEAIPDSCLCLEPSIPAPQSLSCILGGQAFQPLIAALFEQATSPRPPRRQDARLRILPPERGELPPKWAWTSFSLFPLPPPSQV